MGNSSELPPGRSFLVSRGRGAPDPSTPPDEVGVRIFYQLWQKRLHPYGDLADGDMIYWGDQKSREVRWELRVRNVRRAYCRDRNQFEGFLRHWFGSLETDVEYDIGRDTGWLLAWENELVRPLDITLPSGFKFGRSGIKELSQEDQALIGLPEPAAGAMIPVETVEGPVPLFGPEARRNISPALRQAVFERDGRVCQRRGCGSTDGPFHLDHIFPFSKGGPTNERNLQVLCASCNLSKGARADQDDIPEQLLPDSELERLIVSLGRPRPDTVAEAADQLKSLLDAGEISAEEAGLAALETLTDLNNDHIVAENLSNAILGSEADYERQLWADLLIIVPDDPVSEALVIENIDSFEQILNREDTAAPITAVLLAPFIANALATVLPDESSPADRVAALATDRVLQLIDECPLDRLRPRVWILEIALQGHNVQVLNTPAFAWDKGARHPLLETAILYAAYQLALLSEAIESERQALNEPVRSDLYDPNWRRVAVSWLQASSTSIDQRVAAVSAEILAELLRGLGEEGDADAAAMYEAFAERLKSLA
jgi:hypothetical protein